MYFKYLGSPRTEIGVKVFGMTRGLIFVAFVLTALLVGVAAKLEHRHMVAGVAGEHRAGLQCDLPLMGRSDRSNRRLERLRRGPATSPIDTGKDVTDLGA
jgi:hypothetical protein